MANQSKPTFEDTPPVTTIEEVRSSTPIPRENEDPTPRDSNGNEYEEYDGGLTPADSPKKALESSKDEDAEEPTTEQLEEIRHESEEDESDAEEGPVESPIDTRPKREFFSNTSGPLTPAMIGTPAKECSSRKKRSELGSVRRDRIPLTPRQLEPQDIFSLYREMNSILANNVKEADLRQLTLTMQTQISQMAGTVSGFLDALSKLQVQSKSTHGHAIMLEESFKAGISKLEGDVRSAWISQGRNRAAIAQNGESIRSLEKELTFAIGLLKEILARMTPIQPIGTPKEPVNWMYPSQAAQGQPSQEELLQKLIPSIKQLVEQRSHESKKVRVQKKGSPTCAFCSSGHKHFECDIITNWKERRRLVIMNSGCLKCLAMNVDPTSHVCPRDKSICSNCKKGIHHCSVCDRDVEPHEDDGQPPVKKQKPLHKKDVNKPKPQKAD